MLESEHMRATSQLVSVPVKYVYLAGPITGEPVPSGNSWREYVSSRLAQDLTALSPTRDTIDVSEDFPLTLEKMRHGKSVVSRDRLDVRRSDLVFVNFLEARRVSIGTVGEMFWADAFGKPIVLVLEDDTPSNPHFHLMLLELAAWRFSKLDDAIQKTNLLLSDFHSK